VFSLENGTEKTQGVCGKSQLRHSKKGKKDGKINARSSGFTTYPGWRGGPTRKNGQHPKGEEAGRQDTKRQVPMGAIILMGSVGGGGGDMAYSRENGRIARKICLCNVGRKEMIKNGRPKMQPAM